MSKEYFEKIKIQRGDASSSSSDSVRDWDYFNHYDYSEAVDTELADMND
jgi:hypothetical protein